MVLPMRGKVAVCTVLTISVQLSSGLPHGYSYLPLPRQSYFKNSPQEVPPLNAYRIDQQEAVSCLWGMGYVPSSPQTPKV